VISTCIMTMYRDLTPAPFTFFLFVTWVFSACGPSYDDTVVVECDVGETQQLPCGVKDQGTQEQVCIDYVWVNEGRCNDPTECFDGELRTTEDACGFNDRGVRTEVCERGVWHPYDDETKMQCDETSDSACGCEDPDACEEGAVRSDARGLEGSGLQEWVCAQGQWTTDDECAGAWDCIGDEEGMMPCGINDRGEQLARCVDHRWEPLVEDENDEHNACMDPDVCVDGEVGGVVACGLENSGMQDAICKRGQ